MITVENVRTYKGKSVYIGRGSPFGNPFHIGKDGDRDEVIKKYRRFFSDRMVVDPAFEKEVNNIAKDAVLTCYCKPSACHGDIIKEYLDKKYE